MVRRSQHLWVAICGDVWVHILGAPNFITKANVLCVYHIVNFSSSTSLEVGEVAACNFG